MMKVASLRHRIRPDNGRIHGLLGTFETLELGVALPVSHATKPSDLNIDDGSGLRNLEWHPSSLSWGQSEKQALVSLR